MVKANVQKEEAANLFQRVLGTAANMTECKKMIIQIPLVGK